MDALKMSHTQLELFPEKPKRRTKAEMEAARAAEVAPLKRKCRTKAEMDLARAEEQKGAIASIAISEPFAPADLQLLPEEEKHTRVSAKQRNRMEKEDKILEAIAYLKSVSPCKSCVSDWEKGSLRREGYKVGDGEDLEGDFYAFFRVVLPFNMADIEARKKREASL